jgi:hypothetical protein
MTYHDTLAGGRWQQLSLMEQLGNVGSEIYRAQRRRAANEEEGFQLAFQRSLELLDLTLSDPRWSTGRKELARSREVVCDFFVGGNRFGTDADSLQRYFDQFAMAARRGRA